MPDEDLLTAKWRAMLAGEDPSLDDVEIAGRTNRLTVVATGATLDVVAPELLDR
jgi:hypothetical protein